MNFHLCPINVALLAATFFINVSHEFIQKEDLSSNANVTTLAVEVKPIYYNGKLIELYGFAGLGARYYSEKLTSGENNTYGKTDSYPTFLPNTQWTPIGVHVGKKLSGFLELGVGYKGLINGGISYKPSHHTKAVAAKPE